MVVHLKVYRHEVRTEGWKNTFSDVLQFSFLIGNRKTLD